MPDVGTAAERIDILCDEIEHLIEPLPDAERRPRKRIDEGGFDSITLCIPLVLLCDGAADAVEARIERTVAVKRAHKAAEQCSDRDSVVEPRTGVGDSQFDSWV